MTDIEHEFPIAAPIDRVFQAVSTPSGLDQWWTLCWAMYLRVLRRHLENGESVPYEQRLQV